MYPKVSIVVTAFMDRPCLDECLESVMRDDYPNKEVILVTYNVHQTGILLDKYKIDRVINLKKDRGPSGQRNAGFMARNNESRYVLFLDDDVKIAESAIFRLVSFMEEDPNIGISQSLLIRKDGTIDCAGGYLDNLGYTYMLNQGSRANEYAKRHNLVEIPYAASAAMMVRVPIFSDVNESFKPFDASYFINYEDVDLCLRTWLKGFRTVLVSSSTGKHDKRLTSKLIKSPPWFVYLNTRNRLITLLSIYSLKSLIKYMLQLIILETLRALYSLRVKPNHGALTFLGMVWCIRNFKEIWLRRLMIQSQRRVRDDFFIKTFIKPNISRLMSEFKKHYDLRT